MEWFFYEIWGIITGIWKIVINDSVLISIAVIAVISIVIMWLRAAWQLRHHSFILALAITVFIVFLAIFSGLFYYSLAFLINSLYDLVQYQIFNIKIGSRAFRNASLSIAGSVTLLITLLGVVLTIIRSILTRQQNDTGQQKIVTEQISRAIDQIGAYKQDFGSKDNEPNIEARVGGIYSLERIAKDSDRDYEKIMYILCAYVRVRASKKSKSIGEDIQTAIDVLGTKKSWLLFWKRDKFRVNLENCNLSGYRFSELNFNTYASSSKGAIFDDSLFEKSEFHRANLSYVSFDRATLTGANFEYAKLKGARFLDATFKNTKVHGANFRKAKNLTQEQVDEMIGDIDTKLPKGLKLSRIEESPKSKKS